MLAPELADTMVGMDPAAFKQLSQFEREHFWFVARNELIVGLIGKFFPNASRFLEVGCGNGNVIRAVAASRKWERLVGTELHVTALLNARKHLPEHVELVQMDATRIPVCDVFDVTGAFDVIEHIDDDQAVLHELRSSTKRGGGTIVTVPQHPWLWSRADDAAMHKRRYLKGELETKLCQAGFEVIFSSSYTALLLPLMALSRLLDRNSSKVFDVDREFQISKWSNWLLTCVLRIETSATLAGLTWPVGGSRVVVARAI